jgi:mRNA interferase RelE/StbE
MGRPPRYAIEIGRRAARSLRSVSRDRALLRRLERAIQALARDPRPPGARKLAGDRFDNLYRIRVGDWRVLYAIEDDRLVVLVLEVVRRDPAYRPS